MQLSEMGMLYRRVTDFTQERQTATGKGGMTEQVRAAKENVIYADVRIDCLIEPVPLPTP